MVKIPWNFPESERMFFVCVFCLTAFYILDIGIFVGLNLFTDYQFINLLWTTTVVYMLLLVVAFIGSVKWKK